VVEPGRRRPAQMLGPEIEGLDAPKGAGGPGGAAGARPGRGPLGGTFRPARLVERRREDVGVSRAPAEAVLYRLVGAYSRWAHSLVA
jgi:hypothetical protein